MAHRVFIAVCVALGLAGVSIALGTLYRSGLEIERAELEARLNGYELDESEQSLVLATFDRPGSFWTALVSGTLGASLLGLGGVLGLFVLADAVRGPRGLPGRRGME